MSTSTEATAPRSLPRGGTYTPKQLHLDTVDRKLYWGDREGMRVMRCDLDGSNVETLVQTGEGDDDRRDETKWCVGVAVDHVGGHLYWTQKGPSDAGLGRILRAGIDVPAGESAAHRSDIEVVFKDLPEPIDLEIDHTTRMLYWTDRGDPPNGNTVNRAPLDGIGYAEPEIVATHLMEGIGIALDPANDRMFVTDLGGNIYVAALDGSGHRPIRALQGQPHRHRLRRAARREPDMSRHRVVVIGSGFGGLTATKALRNAPVDVTMISRTQHHLFQPLLYQVATGILSEGEIAPATRRILRNQTQRERAGRRCRGDRSGRTLRSFRAAGAAPAD